MPKYYFAYGSNLNLEQIKHRCKDAIKVGSVILKGYELEFRYYLTIKENKNSDVPLGIFKISSDDELNLDVYEGYPHFYRKEKLSIDFNDEKITGIIYIMNKNTRNVMPPNQTYLNTCLKGYQDFDFDEKYLRLAYKNSLSEVRK